MSLYVYIAYIIITYLSCYHCENYTVIVVIITFNWIWNCCILILEMSGISYRTTWGNIKWRPMNKWRRTLSLTKKKHAIAPSINMTFKIFVHMFVMCFLAVMEAGKGVSVLFCFKIEIKRKDRLAWKVFCLYLHVTEKYILFSLFFFYISYLWLFYKHDLYQIFSLSKCSLFLQNF